MKALFLLSFLANIVLTLVALLVSPEEVATHFGTGGAADGWGTRTTNALVMTGVHLLILASFGCTPLLLRKTPDRWINLPHKDYWLRPENRDRVEGMIMAPLYQFGAATFAFMFAIGLLALQANLTPPPVLREDILYWCLGLYLVYTIAWTVWLYRRFRPPAIPVPRSG